MSVLGHEHMNVGALEGQKPQIFLELEISVTVINVAWMPGNKRGSSARVVHSLNCLDHLSVPHTFILHAFQCVRSPTHIYFMILIDLIFLLKIFLIASFHF